MKKAITALLLISILAVAVFPYGAFAADGDITIKEVGEYIYGVPERTTLSVFNGSYYRTGFIMMGVEGGVVVKDDIFLGTGFSLRYESNIGEYNTMILVVLGDIDGNGRVTSGDYLNIRSHLKNTTELSDIKKQAADINGDGVLSALDYVLVKAHFVGSYDIYENQIIPSDSEDDSSLIESISEPWTSGWA